MGSPEQRISSQAVVCSRPWAPAAARSAWARPTRSAPNSSADSAARSSRPAAREGRWGPRPTTRPRHPHDRSDRKSLATS